MKPTRDQVRARLEVKSAAEDRHLDFEEKRLARPFTVKSVDDAGTIEGHGAVFDYPHETSSWALGPEWKDIIRPGAFSKTLAEHKKIGTVPMMLWMHQRGNIPGAWRSAAEDGDGLALQGQVSKAAISPSGVPVYELLKMGAVTGLSIGFRVTKHSLDQEKKTREILSVELSEVSIVDIPGGPRARITDVKGHDPKNIQFLEGVLRDAGLSRKEAKALLAEGFGALRDAAAEEPPNLRDADRDGGSTESIADLIRGLAKAVHP